MRYGPLGATGIEVSRYCLGTMMYGRAGNRDHADCVRQIHAALDRGINFIDTADIYSGGESEQIVGEALKGRRDTVVLATKANGQMGRDRLQRGNSRRWIMQAIEGSLRRLGTDWIDLYQMHRPDYATDMEETLSALTNLIRQGKVRAIGSSTFPPEQIVEAQWAAARRNLEPFRCEQPPYSIFNRSVENAVLPLCEKYNMGVIVWSPLSGGWLTGRYRRAEDIDLSTGRARFDSSSFDTRVAGNRQKFELVEKLNAVAQQAGCSLTNLAMAFTVAHRAVTAAIIGPRTAEQLDDLLLGADITLDSETLDMIDALAPPGTDVGPTSWYDYPAVSDGSLRRR
jgi:aryl-alcohol dehydrogenase-like predicted oxidoreductase